MRGENGSPSKSTHLRHNARPVLAISHVYLISSFPAPAPLGTALPEELVSFAPAPVILAPEEMLSTSTAVALPLDPAPTATASSASAADLAADASVWPLLVLGAFLFRLAFRVPLNFDAGGVFVLLPAAAVAGRRVFLGARFRLFLFGFASKSLSSSSVSSLSVPFSSWKKTRYDYL